MRRDFGRGSSSTPRFSPLSPLAGYTKRGKEDWAPRTDGTYEKGVAQTASAWTGPEWDAAKKIPPPDESAAAH